MSQIGGRGKGVGNSGCFYKCLPSLLFPLKMVFSVLNMHDQAGIRDEKIKPFYVKSGVIIEVFSYKVIR